MKWRYGLVQDKMGVSLREIYFDEKSFSYTQNPISFLFELEEIEEGSEELSEEYKKQQLIIQLERAIADIKKFPIFVEK